MAAVQNWRELVPTTTRTVHTSIKAHRPLFRLPTIPIYCTHSLYLFQKTLSFSPSVGCPSPSISAPPSLYLKLPPGNLHFLPAVGPPFCLSFFPNPNRQRLLFSALLLNHCSLPALTQPSHSTVTLPSGFLSLVTRELEPLSLWYFFLR